MLKPFKRLSIAALLSTAVLVAQVHTPEKIAGTTVFIYPGDATPCSSPSASAAPIVLGTGFSVFLPTGKDSKTGRGEGFRFLITAGHVIANRSSVIVRANRSDKKGFACKTIDLVREGSLAQKSVHSLTDQPQVDIAAVKINNIPDADPTDYSYEMILDKAALTQQGIRIGTDVYTVGYMFGYAGLTSNYPITRFGKVSLITDEYWLSPDPKTGKTALEQGYVIELQNVPGLSGAPVVLSSPQLVVDPISGAIQIRTFRPYILGVIKDAVSSPLGGSQGVGVIEPGDRLRELLRAIASEYQKAGEAVKLD